MSYPGAGGLDPAGRWPDPYSASTYDESVWRRPEGARQAFGDRPAPESNLEPPAYAGPPRATPPRHDWRPRVLVEVPPARRLPGQDDAQLDELERDNALVTRGIGVLAGAIALVLLFIVCGRLVF